MKVKKITDLVQKAQKGDEEAFLQLFQKYETDIYRMSYVYVKNQHDALDVVQETAYRSFKKIHTLQKPEYIKTWLIKIAMSCAVDLLRKEKKVVHMFPDYMDTIPSEDLDLPLSMSLQDLLENINEEEKAIIIWRFYHGYTLKEISEIDGSPLGTVKSLLYRALGKLRKKARRADLYE
ncbi:RNA polymerase sigma (SigV) subunit [Bacillus sp. 349Y]|nr:RNA polymerase sigma (SigV) subunit [Bacillus sp. 349Y]